MKMVQRPNHNQHRRQNQRINHNQPSLMNAINEASSSSSDEEEGRIIRGLKNRFLQKNKLYKTLIQKPSTCLSS